jgi:AAA+ superfamily predicted ATPase
MAELGDDATRIELRATWADLRLAEDQVLVLRGLCRQAGRRPTGKSSVARESTGGPGIAAWFVGGGTAKTAAAEVLAAELGRELYRIDLSAVVSKWIGETEKNLDRLLDAAASHDAVLLFDESDALFGERSEAKDSNDRYANLDIGYLLDRIEAHAGVVILASNRRAAADQAVFDRIRYVVEFPARAPRPKS